MPSLSDKDGFTQITRAKYIPPGARGGSGSNIHENQNRDNRPKGHGYASSANKYGGPGPGMGRAIPDWSTGDPVKAKPRAPLMTIDNFPVLGGAGGGGVIPEIKTAPVPQLRVPTPASRPTMPPAPAPSASVDSPTVAESTILAKTDSEAGTLVSTSNGGGKLDHDQESDQKEYEGGGSMERILSRLLGRAGRHPGSERDLLLYISTESRGYGYLVHYLYDGRFYSEEHMNDVLWLLSDRFDQEDFADVVSYDWKRVDCQSRPHPFLESKQASKVTSKVTTCTVWFEQMGRTGQRAFMEDICDELERPIISLHRKHRLLHAGQDNVTEEEIRAPRAILKTRMPGVSPTGLPR